MLITTVAVLCFNLIFHQGWRGAFGQIIGGDFMVFYSAGQIYRIDPAMLYDYQKQLEFQQALVAPDELSGINPFINPPYVAMLCAILTLLPLPWALNFWTLLAVLLCLLAVYLIAPLIPTRLREAGLTKKQYLILMLSFFPFIEGLVAGQNHALTLLLVTGILVSAHKERWFLAGALAGAMIYKPQLILGLLIVWVIWKNIKALAGFSAVVIIWVGSFLLLNGLSPFLEYLQVSQYFMALPYAQGFPGYILITLYGLLTSIFPATTAQLLQVISQVVFITSAAFVAWLTYRQKITATPQQLPLLSLAFILPLAFSPYVQLHDLLLVAPIFIIWANYDFTSRVLNSAVITFAGTFLFLLLAVTTRIAWMALIPLFLFWQVTLWNASLLKLRPDIAAQSS